MASDNTEMFAWLVLDMSQPMAAHCPHNTTGQQPLNLHVRNEFSELFTDSTDLSTIHQLFHLNNNMIYMGSALALGS